MARSAARSFLCAVLWAAPVAAWTPAAGMRREVMQLLTQRAVQTQVVYLSTFHDEAKSEWVASFSEPTVTMRAERARGRRTF